jgi:hypothetical protein
MAADRRTASPPPPPLPNQWRIRRIHGRIDPTAAQFGSIFTGSARSGGRCGWPSPVDLRGGPAPSPASPRRRRRTTSIFRRGGGLLLSLHSTCWRPSISGGAFPCGTGMKRLRWEASGRWAALRRGEIAQARYDAGFGGFATRTGCAVVCSVARCGGLVRYQRTACRVPLLVAHPVRPV